MMGHNGGPEIVDDALRMRVIRIHINDWIASTRGLSLEQEAFFWRFTLLQYEHMGDVPDNDAANARFMSVDIRTYRRLKNDLIARSKIQVEEGRLSHPRVVREIESFVREHRRRSESATDREARKRIQVADENQPTSARSRPDFGPTSAGDRPEIGAILAGDRPELEGDLFQNPNEINGCSATSVTTSGPEPHARARPKPKPKEEKRVKGNSPSGEHPLPPLPIDDEDPERAKMADVRWAFDAYNATAVRCGLPQATKLTKGRIAGLKQRLGDFGRDGWGRAMANIERSAFLRGRNDRHWRADLEFVLQASSFAKLHDGRYGNGAHVPAVTTPEEAAARAAWLAELGAVAEFGASEADP